MLRLSDTDIAELTGAFTDSYHRAGGLPVTPEAEQFFTLRSILIELGQLGPGYEGWDTARPETEARLREEYGHLAEQLGESRTGGEPG